jgi:hypothetical protein
MVIVNLQIVAQADANKTDHTEHILFATHAIPAVSRAVVGTAQTPTMALTRARGGTRQSAGMLFPLITLKVNLIDTRRARRRCRRSGAGDWCGRPDARGELRRFPCTHFRH